MNDIISKAKTLSEALPYLQKYKDEIFVFKYGGHAMVDAKLRESFLRDIVVLKHIGIRPVIVHGGGPQIEEILCRFGIEAKYADGLRVTDKETMKVVEMVLVGQVNSELVREISFLGGQAVGLSGQDANLILAKKLKAKSRQKQKIDLGEVGDVEKINPELILEMVQQNHFLPVLSPVGVSKDGQALNVNADVVAAEVAVALKAKKLFFLTDVKGLLDKNGGLIESLKTTEVSRLVKNKTIHGGMLPKVKSAVDALKRGVGSVAIIDGRVEHSVLLEIFTDKGLGTLIYG